MSSYLCFICHNVVDSATTEETREKYREVVGMNLCLYSHLCYACCHLVNKLWKFKSVCLKRSLEYPVLFSEKCTLNLIRSDVEVLVLCDETCIPTNRTQVICYNNETKDQSNDYVELEDERNDIDDLLKETSDNIDINTEETVINDVLPTEMDANVTESDDVNDGDMINYFDDNKIENDVIIDRDDSLSQETSNKKKTKKNEKSDFKKIILSLEEQKAELDAQRKTKKYLEAEFKCYNCAQGFLFKDSYQTHMMRHEESNGEYVCVVCTVRFASVAVLRSHVSGHTERYRCRHCARHVRKRQRLTHLRGHGVGGGEAACHLCGNVFQDVGGLQQHLKRFHRNKASTRSYPCGVCGRTYNTQAAVRSHMITHLQHKFVCSSCGATFSSPYSLTQHKKRHNTSGAAHQCAACGRRYHTRKSLLAHMRNALQHQDTVYECPICSRICPNSTSLSLHIARVHSTTKDFACNRCPKKYTSRNSLMRHVREHTSCKTTVKAQCFVCGKSFKNNSRLNRHLREVCRKDKLEEELSAYNLQQDGLLVDMGNQEIGN